VAALPDAYAAGMMSQRRWALAVPLLAAALAACGSGGTSAGGSHYTAADNPCVNSRIANGNWQRQGMSRQVALEGAETLCSYGSAFNSTADSAMGIGPNTSGWDDAQTFGGTRQAGTANRGPAGTSAPATIPSPSPSYATPAAEATGPAGCPGSAALLAAWGAAPASAFQAQGIAPGLQVSGFNGITCWHGWIVADPIANGNGAAVFGSSGGLHVLPGAGMRQFNSSVCAAAAAPAGWKNPATGPAVC